MAGRDNLGGKRAKPFGSKRAKAKRALRRAKAADLSNVDLSIGSITHLKPGQRYRHGWIPVDSDDVVRADEKNPYAGMRRLEAGWAKDGTTVLPKSKNVSTAEADSQIRERMNSLPTEKKGLFARAKERRAEKRLATDRMIEAQKGKGSGSLGSQSEFDTAAKQARERRQAAALAARAKARQSATADPVKEAEARYHKIVKAKGRDSKAAQAALKQWHTAYRFGKTDLSNVDLASNWGAFNAKRKGGGAKVVKPRNATFVATPKPHPTQVAVAASVKSFRKSTGTKSIAGPRAQAILAKRAAKPGHFRAKAIVAAQNGNYKAAKRFEAKRVLAKAARTPVLHAAPKPAKPHPAAVFHAAAPKPKATFKPAAAPKPFKAPGVRGPRKVRVK